MEKIAENHWKGDCFEIKVICGAFFVRPDRPCRPDWEKAQAGFQKLWVELGSVEPCFGQLQHPDRPWPTEEEVAEMIRKEREQHND